MKPRPKAHLRFHRYFTPNSPSWLNMAERAFLLKSPENVSAATASNSVARAREGRHGIPRESQCQSEPFILGEILEKFAQGEQSLGAQL